MFDSVKVILQQNSIVSHESVLSMVRDDVRPAELNLNRYDTDSFNVEHCYV